MKTKFILGLMIVGISGFICSPIKAEAKVANTYYVLEGLSENVLPKYSNSDETKYTYTSSNPSIATVSKNGKVSGKKEGKCTILVHKEITKKDKNGLVLSKNAYEAKYKINVVKLNIKNTKLTLEAGNQANLKVNITNPGTRWLSSDTSVAEVDSSGKLKAKKNGVTTITASYKGVSTTKTVTVEDSVKDALAFTNTPTLMYSGESADISMNKNNFTLESSDNNIVEVNDKSVTAKADGTATITAKHENETVTTTITVLGNEVETAPETVGVKILNDNIVLGVDECTALRVNVDDATLTSSDSNVATISRNVIKGLNPGLTVITATNSLGSSSINCVVANVHDPIKIISAPTTCQAGTVAQVVCNKKNVNYLSSNQKVATIDSQGTLNCLKEGSTVISCISGTDTVQTKISVVGSKSSINNGTLFVGEQLKITTSENYNYASSNNNVATIDVGGVVTGKSAGNCTVYVTDNKTIAMINITVLSDSGNGEIKNVIANAEKYITSLLTVNGEIREVTDENCDTIFNYLKMCKDAINGCIDKDIPVSAISNYSTFEEEVEIYLETAKGTKEDGSEVSLAEIRDSEIEKIETLISECQDLSSNIKKKAKIKEIEEIVDSFCDTYLADKSSLSFMETLSDLKKSVGMK
jgi:hypothetical protein